MQNVTHFIFSHSHAYSIHSLSWSHLNIIPQSLSVHQETCHETSVGHILLTSHFLSLEIGWDFHQKNLSPECFITLEIMHSCIRNFVISGMQSRQRKEKLQHIPECIRGCWCFRWFNPWVHYYNCELTLQSAGVQAYAKKFTDFYWLPKFRFGELWPVKTYSKDKCLTNRQWF